MALSSPMVNDMETSYDKQQKARLKERQDQIDDLIKADPKNPLIQDLQQDMNAEDKFSSDNPQSVAFDIICSAMYEMQEMVTEGDATFKEATDNFIKVIKGLQTASSDAADK